MLAHADHRHAAAEAGGVQAVLQGGGQAHALHGHVEAVAVGDVVHGLPERLGAVVQYGAVQAEAQRVFQLFRGHVADPHLRAAALGRDGRQHPDGARAHHQHPVAVLHAGALYAVIADAEGLDQRQGLGVQALAVDQAAHGHDHVFGEAALALHAHGLVAHAGVHQPPLAGIALAAVEVGIGGDDVADLEAAVVFADLHDLAGKFMAGDAGIGHVGVVAAIGIQVAAADAAVQRAQQRLVLAGNGLFHFADLHQAGLDDGNGFHG